MKNSSGREYPSYIDKYRSGTLKTIADELIKKLSACDICPRRCGVNRLSEERGVCQTGRLAVVASYHAHFGEESVLVGTGGSGTIFFAGCNLKCLFCQNYEISHYMNGREMGPQELARCMLEIQEMGCSNLNLVTPTHVVPQILEALLIAIELGFKLPIVYNTGGYDSIDTLKLLDGIVDIYMPDIKYLDKKLSREFSDAEDYPDIVREVVKEMHRQVGDLVVSPDGLALRGLLVRHLVLPGLGKNTEEVIKFIAEEISKDTYINIMNQYYPCFRAHEHPPLDRPLRMDEWIEAKLFAKSRGITRFDK